MKTERGKETREDDRKSSWVCRKSVGIVRRSPRTRPGDGMSFDSNGSHT